MRVLWLILAFGAVGQTSKLAFGPYLLKLGSSSVTIGFKTNAAFKTTLKFGLNNTLDQKVQETEASQRHFIELKNLKPNTKYFYGIYKDDSALSVSDLNFFITDDLSSNSSIRVWATGDFGASKLSDAYAKIQAEVRDSYQKWHDKTYTNAWLWLGDNAYYSGLEEEYKDNVFDIYPKLLPNIGLFPSPGNHDYEDDSQKRISKDINYYKLFKFPDQGELGGLASKTPEYYSFNKGSAHFVSLDSYGWDSPNVGLAHQNSKQIAWLKKDLAANKLPWTIVYFHHPIYSNGSHNSDAEQELRELRERLVDIFDQYKVSLVLNGHSHVYERSWLIKGHKGHSGSFSKVLHQVQNTNGNNVDQCPFINPESGTIYAVVGSSGRVDVHPNATGRMPCMAYDNRLNGGSMVLDIDQNRLEAQWLAQDGKVYDRFTIFKQTNVTKNLALEYGEKIDLVPSWRGEYQWRHDAMLKGLANVQGFKDSVFVVRDKLACLADSFKLKVLPKPTASLEKLNGTGVFCNGSALDLKISVKNTQAIKWDYTIQLSDEKGSFEKFTAFNVQKNLNPKILIPENTPQGTYNIRVLGSGQYFDFGPNLNLKINEKPVLKAKESAIFRDPKGMAVAFTMTGTKPIQLRFSDGMNVSTTENEYIKILKPETPSPFITKASNVCGEDISLSNVEILEVLAIESDQNFELKMIKNPVENEIRIDIPNATGFLINSYGQRVCEVKSGLNEIKGMAKGLYFLQLYVNGEIKVRKLILE